MSGFDGTATLVRFLLRRDRVRLPLWILGIGGTLILLASSLPRLYETADERQSRAELMENPVTRALSGPGYGADDYTFGAMLANEMLGIMALASALMSIFLVIRHTRAEEESGRSELVRSTVVGRHAATTATLLVVCTAHLAIAALVAIGLPPLHDDFTVAGSLMMGASLAAVGVVFAGIALVAVQLTEHTRGATGYGVAALGVAYTLRAVGDAGFGALSWLSPIGWSQATRAFVDERWWPLLLSLAFAAICVAVGVLLSTRRDVGHGLLATRPGPREASELLVRPLGFALRLQRGMLIAWAIGLLLFGLAYGTLLSEVEAFAEDFAAVEEWIALEGAPFTDSFVAVLSGFFAILAAAAGVQAMLRLRSEEASGRAEPTLVTGLTRFRWAASHLVVAFVGSAVVLLLAGAGMGITGAISTGESGWLTTIPAAALAHLPALWLVVGIATLLYGVAPRFVALTWVVVAWSMLVELLGGFLDIPRRVEQLSPFLHTPAVPASDLDWLPLILLLGLAALGIAIGLSAFNRRDIGAV